MPSKGPTVLPPMETGNYTSTKNYVTAIRIREKKTFLETSAAATQTSNLPAAKQPEPLFVAVPPRPSRVLHSDAYLR